MTAGRYALRYAAIGAIGVASAVGTAAAISATALASAWVVGVSLHVEVAAAVAFFAFVAGIVVGGAAAYGALEAAEYEEARQNARSSSP